MPMPTALERLIEAYPRESAGDDELIAAARQERAELIEALSALCDAWVSDSVEALAKAAAIVAKHAQSSSNP